MYYNLSLSLLSFVIVAFGAPVWSSWLSFASSFFGYALFLRVLLNIVPFKQRFLIATGWFFAVHAVQLSWMVSHPFSYIYAIQFLIAALVGVQFGIFSYWIRSDVILKFRNTISLAALWTLIEWSRLYWLSGYTLHPIGLALSDSIYSLQMVSLGGIYLLSFWVMWLNLVFLRSWMGGFRHNFAWLILLATPYLFGWIHYTYHSQEMAKDRSRLSTLLIQPAFPMEMLPQFKDAAEARREIIAKWEVVLRATKKYLSTSIDLLVIPEYFVPYGTYLPVFPLAEVKQAFANELGVSDFSYFPPLEEPYAIPFAVEGGYLVTNAFFAQALSNLFQADLIVGLEDTEEVSPGKKETYSAAFLFVPNQAVFSRYEKQMLVPLGEYIPLASLRNIAAGYGIQGSFTPGSEAKVFVSKKKYGISICYEETCGHLTRENRLKGADFLVNLTNDAWFPNSRLPQVHYDHVRLRAVENGIPLVRACNTGITGALDSLGRSKGVLGEDFMQCQSISDAIHIQVPTYHYQTLYSRTGDWLIVGISLFAILGLLYCVKS